MYNNCFCFYVGKSLIGSDACCSQEDLHHKDYSPYCDITDTTVVSVIAYLQKYIPRRDRTYSPTVFCAREIPK